MRLLPFLFAATLTACVTAPAPEPASDGPALFQPTVDGRTAVRNFVAVVETVEPVAEAICRARAPQINCDFRIVVDDNPNAPPNAFQTIDATGRPIIAFTVPLIAIAGNRDELAFIMAHEAAHHIRGHIQQARRNASLGAFIFGQIAGAAGAGSQEAAQRLGATIGARTYSKEFELEADALGAIIAERAGYDAVRGAAFFQRLPDPRNQFLGSHPPNSQRLQTVRNTVANL